MLKIGLAVVAAGLFYVFVLASGYARARLTSFLNPWASRHSTGFQAVQGQIAIGSGGLFGVGPGASVQKIFYLPEAQTDFIVAVVGEELGVVGVCGVLLLYGVIAVAGLRAAQRARSQYAALIAVGVTVLIVSQALLNIFAVLGLAPLTGVPLPLISYGSSSMIVTLACDGPAARRRRRSDGPRARGRADAHSGVGRSSANRRLNREPATKIVIAAGGTAGHVVPALAVARELSAAGCDVEFIGADRAESELVPAAGFPLHSIVVRGISRTSAREAARALGTASRAGVHARRLLARDRARCGARRRRLRCRRRRRRGALAAHPAGARRGRQPPRPGEPHARAVRARRLPGISRAARGARSLCRHWTPDPIRRSPTAARREKRWGCRAGSACSSSAARWAPARSTSRPLDGLERDADATCCTSAAGATTPSSQRVLPAGYDLRDYLDREHFAMALAAADLAVGRSGGSVFELAAQGLPSLLVPYPLADRRPPARERPLAGAGAARRS